MSADPVVAAGGDPWPGELAAAFERLDRRLLAALEAVGTAGEPDPFRGLYVDGAGIAAAFDRPAAVPRLGPPPGEPGPPPAPLAWLRADLGLTAFDVDVVLICLAPEVDLRYQRVYAYLADDVRRRRPTVELVLDLLCGTAADKLARRARLAPDAPLLAHGVVHLDPPDDDRDAPLLAHALRLDPQIVDVLLGQAGLDRRLAGWCRLVHPGPGGDGSALAAAVGASPAARIFLHAASAGAGRAAALSAAAALSMPLLEADLAAAGAAPDLLPVVVREATFHGAMLLLTGTDAVADDPAYRGGLLAALAAADGAVLVAGSRPFTGGGFTVLPVPPPGADRRRESWRTALAGHGIRLAEGELDLLAARFRFDLAAVEDTAAAAPTTAALRGSAVPGLDDVSAAARERCGHELAGLTRRVRPYGNWDDLVLPPDAHAQLREVCDRARHRDLVLTEWGLGRGGQGTGTSVLFTGGSGTGKTTAAHLVAAELGLDLYAIDLARVVSKYIGETEKNLDRIFTAAADTDAVLFFDEADALFGKRSEVRDSHDRYANIEVSFLLQRIEQFTGVAILATNLRQHLDEALLRRLAFTVSFPFPDEQSRRRLWEVVWPGVPRAADVDLSLLAGRFALSGGNIRNVALAAAYLAAADDGVVGMRHVLHAVRREYQKLGKALGPADLTDLAAGPA